MLLYPFFRIYGAGAVWLSLRSILGRARGTLEWERRTPLLFSNRASSTFLLSPSADPKSVLIKLHDKKKKKKEIVYSFSGIPMTCKLEMESFFTQSEIITVSCLRNAIESKTALSRGT